VKIAHILTKREFADIFKNGRKVSGGKVSLYFKGGSREERLSVGIVISKKVVSGAVQRNYLRRLIYLYYRENASNITEDTSVVVRITGKIKSGSRSSVSKVMREELETLSHKAGIIK
jgi:ribonuclease P protein component